MPIVMRMMISILLCSGFCAFAAVFPAFSAELKITLTAEKAPKDKTGTDTADIYTFFVEPADKNAVPSVYTIVYFLDGQPQREWKGQKVPFSFMQNFKGMQDGSHAVKIDVEDSANGNRVVATANVNIQVKK